MFHYNPFQKKNCESPQNGEKNERPATMSGIMRIIQFGIQRKIKAAEKMKKEAIVPDEVVTVDSYIANAPDKVSYFSQYISTNKPPLQYQHSQRFTPAVNNHKRRNSYHGNSGQKTFRFRRFRIKV